MPWKMPEYSEKERKDMPSHVFLLPSERKFPYKSKDKNGKWVVRPNMLRAAMSRAGQHGYPAIYKKAKRLYDKMKDNDVKKSIIKLYPLAKSMVDDGIGDLDEVEDVGHMMHREQMKKSRIDIE
jgi:hypothetical protein